LELGDEVSNGLFGPAFFFLFLLYSSYSSSFS
jgi:hypothetical protein